MSSPNPGVARDQLMRLDAPLRALFERVADALGQGAPDLPAIGAAMVELAADHDYLAPRVRGLGEASGWMALHVPDRGPRLMLVHRRAGQMGAAHDHGCWVGLAPVTGIETHRRFRRIASAQELSRLELVGDQALAPGEVVTMLAPDDIHAHGHQPGRGEAAYVLIMTGDDQRVNRRTEWDAATGRSRVLQPGDGGRWLETQPFPG